MADRIHPARALWLAPLLIIGGVLIANRMIVPSHERVWRPEQAVLPVIELSDGMARVGNVRDFEHRGPDDLTERYLDRTYAIDRIERVWLVISPLSGRWRGPAHLFVSFEFADSQFVSVSVEARREVGEEYSILKGAFRRFELIYVIGEERDLIGTRAVTWNVPVHLYPIRSTRDQARDLFVSLLERARDLEDDPQFYNTFTNNCTTNILTAVNEVATDPIPYGIPILLPGYADRLVYERGLIETDLSFEEAREAFLINDRARAAYGRADFSTRIRS